MNNAFGSEAVDNVDEALKLIEKMKKHLADHCPPQ